MPVVEAVIFDWGGTLTPWHTVDLRAQWRTTYAAHTHPGDDAAAESLTDALLAAEAHVWGLGRNEHQHRSARLADVLQHAATASGLDRASLHTCAVSAAYEEFWEPHTRTDAQVLPLWSWLREQGLAVGVLSNTIWSRDYHRAIFARDGVLHLIDGDVYSSEIDVVKPHADAFLAAAEAVGVAPQHCVYVGDRLYEDIHGPQQVGMRTIHIPHSDIPRSQYVAVDAVPDAVAHQLADIAGIVQGWQAGAAR